MTNESVTTKKRPGARLLTAGLVVLAIGVAILLMNLTNPVTNYVAGAGMVTTQGPSAGSVVLIIAGLLIAAIGFGKRLLAAVEK